VTHSPTLNRRVYSLGYFKVYLLPTIFISFFQNSSTLFISRFQWMILAEY